MNIWRFLKGNWPLLGFGFAMTAGSGFGQTFFVGIFNSAITQSLDLSATAFGSMFSIATLMSAGLFVWTGKIVDWLSLRAAAVSVICCLSLFCLVGIGWRCCLKYKFLDIPERYKEIC